MQVIFCSVVRMCSHFIIKFGYDLNEERLLAEPDCYACVFVFAYDHKPYNMKQKIMCL